MECMKNNLYGKFFSVMHQFHKLNMAEMFPANLTKMDGITLMSIEHFNGEKTEEKITISELAEKIHTKSSAVSRTLKSLEEKGLVERQVNKADRRNTYVEVTGPGRDVMKECFEIMDDFSRAVIAKMNADDMERLVGYLDELYQVSKHEIELRKYNSERKQEHE